MLHASKTTSLNRQRMPTQLHIQVTCNSRNNPRNLLLMNIVSSNKEHLKTRKEIIEYSSKMKRKADATRIQTFRLK